MIIIKLKRFFQGCYEIRDVLYFVLSAPVVLMTLVASIAYLPKEYIPFIGVGFMLWIKSLNALAFHVTVFGNKHRVDENLHLTENRVKHRGH